MNTALDEAVARVEARLGTQGLASRLATDLKNSELSALLLAVYRQRAAQLSPADLLTSFTSSPFVQPAAHDPVAAMALDSKIFRAAQAFDPCELSPLCPLGTSSALAPVDQNKNEATARGREVISDPTNVLALEAARRRQSLLTRDHRAPDPVRLCTSQRVVRCPPLAAAPGFTQHFRLFAMLTSGRAQAGVRFELEAMHQQLGVIVDVLAACRLGPVHLRLIDRSAGHLEALEALIAKPLTARHSGLRITCTSEREGAETYYPDLSFIMLLGDEKPSSIADGGVVDWTAKLLSNRKERCVISGLGTQRLLDLLPAAKEKEGE